MENNLNNILSELVEIKPFVLGYICALCGKHFVQIIETILEGTFWQNIKFIIDNVCALCGKINTQNVVLSQLLTEILTSTEAITFSASINFFQHMPVSDVANNLKKQIICRQISKKGSTLVYLLSCKNTVITKGRRQAQTIRDGASSQGWKSRS